MNLHNNMFILILFIHVCSSKCDYTIFFRELIVASSCNTPEEAYKAIEYAFFDADKVNKSQLKYEWIMFFELYLIRIQVCSYINVLT